MLSPESSERTVTPEMRRPNGVDQDFAQAEAEPHLETRAQMTQLLVDELTDGRSLTRLQAETRGDIVSSTAGDGVEASYISDTSVTPESRQRFIKTPSRRIVPVGQCRVWDLPDDKRNYAVATMSECSFLAAPTESGLVVAHLGNGEVGQLAKAVELMRQAGADFHNAQAVINNNPYPGGSRPAAGSVLGHAGAEVYRELGLPEENIHEFTYERENGRHKGLVEVMVAPGYLHISSFDTPDGQTKGEYYNELTVPAQWQARSSVDNTEF